MNLNLDWLDGSIFYDEEGEYIYTRLTSLYIEAFLFNGGIYQIVLN